MSPAATNPHLASGAQKKIVLGRQPWAFVVERVDVLWTSWVI